MSVPVVSLAHLTKHFGQVVAVDDVSFEITKGEVLALLGPSGCGKTTTLRLLAGLEAPDEGEIFFEGRPVVSVRSRTYVPPHKRSLGMVFQSYAIWPHMSVFDNVAYPLRVRHVDGRRIRERVMRMLELVGLAGLENRQGPALSGGQQQRVAVARALVSEPSVLLLDEPFSNLDAKLREQMRVQLKLLLRQLGITTVFVTHDQAEALILSDRVAVMNQGHIEQLGSPQEVYERPTTPFVRDFLGNSIVFHGVVCDASEEGISVRLKEAPNVVVEASYLGSALPQPGLQVVVAVRPEDVEVGSNGRGSGGNSLAARVEAVFFVGDHYECRVRPTDGSESVLLHTPRLLQLREGEEIALRIREGAASAWPA